MSLESASIAVQRPHVASARSLLLKRTFLAFAQRRAQTSVALHALGWQTPDGPVVMLGTNVSEVSSQLNDGILANHCHPYSCADAVALASGVNDSEASLNPPPIHNIG